MGGDWHRPAASAIGKKQTRTGIADVSRPNRGRERLPPAKKFGIAKPGGLFHSSRVGTTERCFGLNFRKHFPG
jgi:hypothetical protein